MFKYKFIKIREYIFIILTATIFFFSSTAGPNAKENIFIVDDIKIEEAFDVNFSREKFINKAFKKSFNKLLSNILLREDIDKLKKLKLKQIKNLIYSFKILDEKFKDGKYSARYVVTYDDFKIKKLLNEKNISFYDPKNTTLIFFPIIFINDEVKIFGENFFYNNWLTKNSKDLTIQYILPLEDLDQIFSINKIKNEIENLDFKKLAMEYNTENYAVAIMTYESAKLKIYLKTNLDSKQYNENLSYELKNWNGKSRLNFIMDNLKLTILDMWKRANLINIPLPLNILVKFKFDNLKDLHNLEKILNEIHVINTYSLEQFDFKTSFFKINYYGDPKNLSDEFSRFSYLLKDNQGSWELQKK